jgi:hypothetical protein
MRIDRLRPGETAATSRPAGTTGRFAELLSSSPDTVAAGGVVPASPVALRMTYEAACDAVSADREARRHGRALLRALGAIQLALLVPYDRDEGGEARAQLARLAATTPVADDPMLSLILREIGMRAAVELARLDA